MIDHLLRLVPQGIPAELMLLFIGAVCSLAGILTSKALENHSKKNRVSMSHHASI